MTEYNRNEEINSYWKRFISLREEIDEEIEELNENCVLSSTELIGGLDEVTAKTNQMQDMTAAGTLYLPSYDVLLCNRYIYSTRERINEIRKAKVPRKKFKFKSRTSRPTAGSEKAEGPTSASTVFNTITQNKESNEITSSLNRINYENLDGEVITINETIIQERFPNSTESSTTQLLPDVGLSNLKNCIIYSTAQLGSIHGTQLHNCKLYFGPVAGSVFLEDSTNSVFMLACRQLRLHTSKECDFYLRILSNPIIEDCSHITVNSYRLQYNQLQEQLERNDMANDNNLWSNVVDFRWHRKQHSPNWELGDGKAEIDHHVAHAISLENA